MFFQFANVNENGHVVSESKKYGPVRTVRIRKDAILVNGSVFATKFEDRWKFIESTSWNRCRIDTINDRGFLSRTKMAFRDGLVMWDDVFVTGE